jgi:hypothetical protein
VILYVSDAGYTPPYIAEDQNEMFRDNWTLEPFIKRLKKLASNLSRASVGLDQ